jgi:Zn-finger nucleic acid-binding protein
LQYAPPADRLVDHCEGCGGVFLDRGEIGKLHRLSAHLEHPSKRLEAAAKYLDSQGYEVIGVRKT